MSYEELCLLRHLAGKKRFWRALLPGRLKVYSNPKVGYPLFIIKKGSLGKGLGIQIQASNLSKIFFPNGVMYIDVIGSCLPTKYR